jgi:hypothetical protein
MVLIPGGGALAEAVRAAHTLSRNLTVLLAPRQMEKAIVPTRAEVVELAAVLAEDPAAVRALLTRGLSEEWWRDVPALNHALRLTGTMAVVLDEPWAALPGAGSSLLGEAAPALLATLSKAKLIVLGPGEAESNLLPVLAAPGLRAALAEASARCLHVAVDVDAAGAAATRETWLARAQALLLGQAAGRAKTAH